MQQKQNSETDRFIKSSSTSSSDEAEFFSLPTGTFSLGADIVYETKNSFMLVQSKSSVSNLTQESKNHLKNHKNRKQAKQAIKLLEAIENLVKGYDDLDLSGIKMSFADVKYPFYIPMISRQNQAF